MKIIGYSIAIISFLSILYQVVLTVLYLKPFVLDSILKRKKSWNPYYDPTFTILLCSFCVITIGFTYLLVSDNTLTDAAIMFYAALIFLINTFFSLIFFNRKGLAQRKTREQLNDQEKKIKKNIRQKEYDEDFEKIKNSNLKGNILLNTHINQELLNKEIMNEKLDYLTKITSQENIKKTQINKVSKDLPNYNSLFNENQLIYLFLEFKKHGIIDDDYLKKDFMNKFLSEQIMINMEGTSLYYLHREISKVLIKKITLKHFVTFFKNNKGNNFDFDSVRQAVNNKNHKLVLEFKEIFECFLDKHSLQSKECKS